MSTASEVDSKWYKALKGKIAEEILDIRDGKGNLAWESVHEKSLGYFIRNCLELPWTNHLALIVLVRTLNQYDLVTVLRSMQEINPRLKDLFSTYGLTSIDQLIPDEHIYKYLTNQILETHSSAKRLKFLNFYNSCNRLVHEWLRTKYDEIIVSKLKQYVFPPFSYHPKEIHLWRSANEQAKQTRKNETDAIVPLYPRLRAEAHLRWNQLKRLRVQFLKVIEEVECKNIPLPLEFNYDDKDVNDVTIKNAVTFFFRLWDQRSFVLSHQDKYSKEKVREAKRKARTYSDENKEFFLEFVKAENTKEALCGQSEPEGL
ncbi:hypothetical protein ACFYU8_05585 [Brevibacillus sp. NPDC003359]|uniref:hypothetical protein n=1 Tax=unclassified Brevibacillus TaxID=2684853 RepID=UPI0036AA3F77